MVARSLVVSLLAVVLLLSAACGGVAPTNAPLSSRETGQARIGWPFDTTTSQWVIENGYNWNTSNGGLDHGCSTTGSTCYEQYSFDFQVVGTPGATTGIQILSPVSGTLVDFGSATPGDGSSGYCVSVDVAGYSGYHVLICHMQNQARNRDVTRGDVIGQVAGGVYGDHIHMTLYYLDPATGNDNSANAANRKAIPFTDPWTIGGCPYPVDGSENQWRKQTVPCANSSSIEPPSQVTPTFTPTAVPTTSPLEACRSSGSFASASPPDVLAANFVSGPTVPFPPLSLGYVERTFSDPSLDQPGMVYQFELIAVCTAAITPSDVRAFFAANMPTADWSQSNTFPYGGNYGSQCGDPYCWVWGPNGGDVSRFASLENVKQVGTLVTYELRIGVEGPQ